MTAPFFSVIIPTRNRYETLDHSIRTVLEQDFVSYELIISDNSDEQNLSGVKTIDAHLQHPLVKYYRPPSVLPMSDHWEFAISKAEGKYIIIFGDDDGLVAGALKSIHNVIHRTGSQVVGWARVEYSWPDRTPAEYANMAIIPYAAKTGLIDGEQYIKKVIAYKADYRYLPMLYSAAVSSELVQTLKEKTGRVFNASSPDIYTGFAFAHLAKKFVSIGYPLSINGVSSKSNGAAHLNQDESVKADYWKLQKTSSIKWPDSLPNMYTSFLGIIEPFIQLSNFFGELKSYQSRKETYKLIVDTLEVFSEQDAAKKTAELLNSCREDKGLFNWISEYVEKNKPVYQPAQPFNLQNKIGFDGSHLNLDASKFGVKNVYDVSVFIKHLFGEFKEVDYLKPVERGLLSRIKRASGIILKGV